MSAAKKAEFDQASFEQVLSLIHKHTGITVAPNKKTMVEGRLRPRMKALNFEEYSAYFQYLKDNKDEVQLFINSVTTNETTFFRTMRVWDFFNSEFLPSWFAKNPKKTLKIWSAAASTGEEAHTIGICCEEFRGKNPTFNYQIVGTDISTEVLGFGEKGEYFGRTADLFKAAQPQLFEKYMVRVGDKFKANNEIRSRIKFVQHNLFNRFNQVGFDIVFIRNVLIYFEPQDQEKVLANIGHSTIEAGTLVVGESETLSSIKTPFLFKTPLIYEKSK